MGNFSEENGTTKVQEFQFHDVPKTGRLEGFLNAIYDPSKQEFLGRTKRRWYELLRFYTCFYICLAALFAICMKGLLSTLDDTVPKRILDDSLIGTNPGLGFRPISSETAEGSLIWYNLHEPYTGRKWVKLLDRFLAPYLVDQAGKNFKPCDYDQPIDDGHVCTVEVDKFGPCSPQNHYGYNTSSPCVFLKLNRIFDWVPEFIAKGQKGMPEDLRETIEAEKNKTQVWVSCKGEKPFNKERVGEFRYYPSRGFPGYYFPYKNTPNYLSPLIAVQITNVKPNAIVSIECRAWAKNIIYSGSDRNREGSVKFEILIDDLRA